MKKNRFFSLLAILVITSLTTGCIGGGGLWKTNVTSTELKSSTAAAQVAEISKNNSERAKAISLEAKDAKKELKDDVKNNVLPEDNAALKIQRWDRVDSSAKLIAKDSDIAAGRGIKIMKINQGEVELTWWGWCIILGIVSFLILGLFGYLTMLLKQWGILKVIRTGVEGTSELVAKGWLADDTKDDAEMPPEMFEKAVRKRRTSTI